MYPISQEYIDSIQAEFRREADQHRRAQALNSERKSDNRHAKASWRFVEVVKRIALSAAGR